MNVEVPEILLHQFSRFLKDQIGLHFKKEKWRQLTRGMEDAAKAFGFKTPGRCMQWLMSAKLSREQVETLSSFLTISETYFFRELSAFKELETRLIPQLPAARSGNNKNLRIWSAACSTGEEPYSIAMMLDQMRIQLREFRLLVLATDINRSALKKAETGLYSEWSFRSMPLGLKKKYFTTEGKNQHRIRPFIREMVLFDFLNLVEDVCPSRTYHTFGMDIIFCRNVLMYFSKPIARRVVENLYRCLLPGGWLVVSPTDAFSVLDVPGFQLLETDAPIYLKVPRSEPFYPQVPVPPVEAVEPLPPTPPAPETIAAEPAPSPPPPEQPVPVEPDLKRTLVEARRLFNQGFYPGVIRLLMPLVESGGPGSGKEGPANHRVYHLLARGHANRGEIEEAGKWGKLAVEANRLDPHYRYLLATIQLEAGKPVDAAVSLKQALYINPDFIPAHFTLGNIAFHGQNYGEANRHFRNTLTLLEQLEPESPLQDLEEKITAGRLRDIITHLMNKESFDE